MWKPYLIALMSLSLRSVVAQTDSTLLEYYPLQIGNRWEYEDRFEDFQQDTTLFKYFSLEVVADTVMQNQRRYQVLLRKSIPDTLPHEYFYERIDSALFNIYRYDIDDDLHNSDEFFIDSLRLIITGGEFVGSSRHNHFIAGIYYGGSSEDTILNHPTILQHFHANDIVLIFGFEYWFARGLGLVRGLTRETLWRNPTTLIYAEINGRSFGNPVSVELRAAEPKTFRLFQNYPNPFNPRTSILYELPTSGEIELNIYNILGQKVRTVFQGFQTAGTHKVEVEAADLASGVYVYEIKFESLVERRKFMLLK